MFFALLIFNSNYLRETSCGRLHVYVTGLIKRNMNYILLPEYEQHYRHIDYC